MSDCCSTKQTDDQNAPPPVVCPQCREKGKSVDIRTLKSLLRPEAMRRLDPAGRYQFCRTPGCPIVYFHPSAAFSKDDLTVEVFQKEASDATPVCYCFGFDRKGIIEDVRRNGKSTIIHQIKQYVKEGKCACDLRNPQGSCCLGNIAGVIKE